MLYDIGLHLLTFVCLICNSYGVLFLSFTSKHLSGSQTNHSPWFGKETIKYKDLSERVM